MKKSSFLTVHGLARVGWQLILWVSVISLILGFLAALLGGSLIPLGNGPGGGNGIPDLVLTLAVLLGIPGLFRGIIGTIKKKKRTASWMLVFILPLIIAFGYILIAHALDPCFNGLWDMSSRIGDSIPLCERFGAEINIHTRFHYLWHILPTLPLIWLYRNGLKKRLPEVVEKNNLGNKVENK